LNVATGNLNGIKILLVFTLTFIFYFVNWRIYYFGVLVFGSALQDEIRKIDAQENVL